MIFYHNTVTNQLRLTLDDVRQAMPHCSIPVGTTVVGDFVAYNTSAEPITAWFERAIEITPVNGQQVWQIEALTQAEQDTLTTDQIITARATRDSMLRECDWTQLADVALDAPTAALWVAYRQALRNVPNQGGYPWTINWPTAP
jgi:hypothetical protein